MNDEADALSNFKLAGTANDQRIEYEVRGLLRPDYGSEDKGKDQAWRRHMLGRSALGEGPMMTETDRS